MFDSPVAVLLLVCDRDLFEAPMHRASFCDRTKQTNRSLQSKPFAPNSGYEGVMTSTDSFSSVDSFHQCLQRMWQSVEWCNLVNRVEDSVFSVYKLCRLESLTAFSPESRWNDRHKVC